MVFKTLGTILGNFVGKSFESTIKDFKLSGGNIASTLFKSSDTIALQKFNQELQKGVDNHIAYRNVMSTASDTAKKQALSYIKCQKNLEKYDVQLNDNKITQEEYNARVDATKAKMATLGVETQTLTVKERVLNVTTKALAVGFQLVKAAVATISFSLIIAGITEVVNGQTELREKIKQTADEAKQSHLQFPPFTNPHPPHNIKKREIAGATLRSSAEYITERRGKMNENDKCSTDGLTIPRGRFPQDTPLAMAYVPYQEWEDTYAENVALAKGTIFPSLDMPFLGKEGVAQYGK